MLDVPPKTNKPKTSLRKCTLVTMTLGVSPRRALLPSLQAEETVDKKRGSGRYVTYGYHVSPTAVAKTGTERSFG